MTAWHSVKKTITENYGKLLKAISGEFDDRTLDTCLILSHR
jgi:hypothetical protein